MSKQSHHICARWDHLILIQDAEQLSTWLAELQEEAGKVQQSVVEIRSENSFKNFPPRPVDNYKVCVIADY